MRERQCFHDPASADEQVFRAGFQVILSGLAIAPVLPAVSFLVETTRQDPDK
jgi:hypothetical protein